MNFFENIKIAVDSIRSNKMRSLLTMLGIIIGIASVIMIVSVGSGATGQVVSMFEQIGANTVQVRVNSQNASDADYFTFEDIEAVKEKLTEVKYASVLMSDVGTLTKDGIEVRAMITAGSADLQYVYAQEFASGRFYLQSEYENGTPVIVLSEDGAAKLFGSIDCVGQSVDMTIDGRRQKVKVVGVTKEDNSSTAQMSSMMGMDPSHIPAVVMMPATAYMNLSGDDGRISSFYFVAVSQAEMDDASSSAVALLEARHGNRGLELYKAQNFLNALSAFEDIMSLLTTFIAVVAAISLLVGGIGVMNIMLVSVTERTREIGIRKALGARTGTILFQFLTESGIITLIGGTIGTALGVGGGFLIGHLVGVTPRITLTIIVIALLFSAAVGMFFGIYPARKAARLRPIEALRRE